MIAIPNTRTPKAHTLTPVATFRLELYRDGDKIVLDTARPQIYRQFGQFTAAEKAAYQNLVAFIVDRAQEAMTLTREEIEERTARLVAKKKGSRQWGI